MVLMSPRNKGRAAFTLVELLVVIGIMAVLATISIAGYNAASRGMSDRGVIQATASILQIAKQTCELDRVPTKVLFLNRRFASGSSAEDATLYQGTAIAIKQMGRITIPHATMVIDEFADWHQSYPMLEPAELNQNDSPGMLIYRMTYDDRNKETDKFSMKVKPFVTYYKSQDFMIEANVAIDRWCQNHRREAGDNRPRGASSSYVDNGNNYVWGFMESKDNTGLKAGDWKVGDPYGVEIARIDLPKGYIFGSDPPSEDVLEASSVKPVYFAPRQLEPSPSGDVPVYAMRRLGNSYTAKLVERVNQSMLKDD